MNVIHGRSNLYQRVKRRGRGSCPLKNCRIVDGHLSETNETLRVPGRRIFHRDFSSADGEREISRGIAAPSCVPLRIRNVARGKRCSRVRIRTIECIDYPRPTECDPIAAGRRKPSFSIIGFLDGKRRHVDLTRNDLVRPTSRAVRCLKE